MGVHRPGVAWYVARTEPQREQTACVFVRSAGWEGFVPFIIRRVLRAGRVVPRRELMFPSYIFIQLRMDLRAWAELRRSPGIVGVLQAPGDELPTPLAAGVVARVRERSQETVPHALEVMQYGDPLCITGGPFQGLDALFAEFEGDRVIALISLFGRTTLVPIETALVAQARA